MALVVALGPHIRVCRPQVQKPKPVVDMNLSKAPVASQAEVQARFLPMETHPAELAKRDGIVPVEDVILSFEKVRRAFQLLRRIRSKPDNHLELMVTGQRAVFSLDVDEFLNQTKCIAQCLSLFPIRERGMHHGMSDAYESGALRSIQLPEDRRGQGQPIGLDATTSEKCLEDALLFGREILEEQPVDQKRLEKNVIRA